MEAGEQTPYLTIGPWGHIAPEVGWESLRQAVAWFDVHLKKLPERLRPAPVRLYVMGSDTWRDFSCWPPTVQTRSYYLHANHRLLPDAPDDDADTTPDQYRYDPADPTPNIGGSMLVPDQVGTRDTRTLEARPDVLCYTSAVLEQPMTVIGCVRLVLYVHSTAPSTDFVGRVCDVHPDGRSMNVCDGLVRLHLNDDRYPIREDGSRRIEIELWPTAYTFLAGHRVRLHVASAAHPRWNRNLGTGEPVADATMMLVAIQTLYHTASHPSVITFPVE